MTGKQRNGAAVVTYTYIIGGDFIMIYLWLILLSIFVIAIIFYIRKRKRKDVNFSLYIHAYSKSLKENINNMKKISKAHKPVNLNSRNVWAYNILRKKWRIFRKDYDRLYSLQGKYDDLVPASKWITDNYYLINRNIKQVVKNFNKKNCRNLPAITIGSSEYYPRIYVVAKELVAMMDYNFSEKVMLSLIKAYQEINSLKISELWALPVMIKLCLLEDISLLVDTMKHLLNEKVKADIFINNVLQNVSSSTNIVDELIRQCNKVRCSEPLSFSSQILFRLMERGVSNNIDLGKIVVKLPCSETLLK